MVKAVRHAVRRTGPVSIELLLLLQLLLMMMVVVVVVGPLLLQLPNTTLHLLHVMMILLLLLMMQQHNSLRTAHSQQQLLLLAHAGKPSAEPILALGRGGRRDGGKLLAHGVTAVGPLDGVGGLVGDGLAAVPVGDDLVLPVQQVLAQLVGLRHLGPAEAFSARLLAHAAQAKVDKWGPTAAAVPGVTSNSLETGAT